jgi:TadE-like protein
MKFTQQKGVVAIEMALILVPMLILCFGITELGRALYQYNGLVKATRGAVRYLSQQSMASPPAGETADSLRLRPPTAMYPLDPVPPAWLPSPSARVTTRSTLSHWCHGSCRTSSLAPSASRCCEIGDTHASDAIKTVNP